MRPRASYRLQLHKDFTFRDAAATAGYLAALGVSHVYTSPIFTARAGSLHGYDVIDPSRLNPELGGEDGYRFLVSELRRHGLRLIVDIVPNHMAVGKADNAWWLDVLQNGRDSPHAGFFDIDWDAPGLEGKVLAPFLDGTPADLLAKGDLRLCREGGRWAFGYFDHRFPLRPQDQAADWSRAKPADMEALLQRQNFVLADWREADSRINWRRFFDITDLAAIRVGEPQVFQAVHEKLFALYGEGLIDGVRIDHVDGIADPNSYCRLLRDRLDQIRPGAYVVVEKILADQEALPDWGVDGTTGYDFMNEVSALLHDQDGGALEAVWQRQSGRGLAFEQEEAAARREMLETRFRAQFDGVCRAFTGLLPALDVRAALGALIVNLRCYRSYATGLPDSPGPGRHLVEAMARTTQQQPELAPVLEKLNEIFGASDGDPATVDALRRFHQLSAPVAAKAVEDTAFYRYGRLLSRNDVGFDPRRHTLAVTDFHRRMAARSRHRCHAMLATATHDHKRGEDSRARLAALTTYHQAWEAFVAGQPCPAGLHPADHYQLLQTLVGAWPVQDADGAFADRVAQWCEKYLREAKLRSSWARPDTAYETQMKNTARRLILDEQSPFRGAMAQLLRTIQPQADANSLVQTVLHLTVPGVPDIYQGCEFADLSLVDPDNRRPVDYAARAEALQAGRCLKQRMIATILACRKADPALWAEGDYVPLLEDEPAVLAFSRRHQNSTLLVLAARHASALTSTLSLPHPFVDLISGRQFGPADTPLGAILQEIPVAALYHKDKHGG